MTNRYSFGWSDPRGMFGSSALEPSDTRGKYCQEYILDVEDVEQEIIDDDD